jgi:hypothetical protein
MEKRIETSGLRSLSLVRVWKFDTFERVGWGENLLLLTLDIKKE